MPNRVLRDWTTSDNIDQLSSEAEVFFTRLIMKADDFGNYPANPRLLKSALYPLREVSTKQVEGWLKECLTVKIVRKYHVDGKDYLTIPNFDQRLRAKRSKYPLPPDGHVSDIGQSDDGHTSDNGRPETETNPKLETKQNPKPNPASAEPLVLPFGSEFLAVWQEWEQYRLESKKRLTRSTAKKQIALLGARPEKVAIAMINQSIQNGWQGIFEIKQDSNGAGFNKNKQHLFGVVEGIAQRYGKDGSGGKG